MLQKNQVIFDEEKHTYTLGDKKLKGITWIISKYIKPDKYINIPQDVLDKAIERGHTVHKEIEMYVNGFPFSEVSNETSNFYKIAKDIKFIESEYCVTDEVNFASNIDIIDSNYNLYDIKTTYSLDKESLSWQLSIYAYLFELQTGEKAGSLYGIWLHGDTAKIVDVERIDNEHIKTLLDAAINDAEWENPFKPAKIDEIDDETLAQLYEVESKIAEIEKKAEALKETEKLLREALLAIMEEKKCKKYESDNLVITYVEPSTRTTVDSKKLKAEQPDIYKEYSKESVTSASVRIKIK